MERRGTKWVGLFSFEWNNSDIVIVWVNRHFSDFADFGVFREIKSARKIENFSVREIKSAWKISDIFGQTIANNITNWFYVSFLSSDVRNQVKI